MSGDKPSISNIALEAIDAALRVVPTPLRDLVGGSRVGDSRVGGSRSGDSTNAAGHTDRTTSGANGGVGVTELANDLASLLVRFTAQIAKEVASAAGELGSVVSKHPTVGAVTEPFRSATKMAMEPQPLILELPDASPGQTTSVALMVRNDSLDTFDGVRLRCFMLLGPGGTSISGDQVSFTPASVDILPNTTATVECQVIVPVDTTRAQYQGLIDAIDIGGVQLMVGLHVI